MFIININNLLSFFLRKNYKSFDVTRAYQQAPSTVTVVDRLRFITLSIRKGDNLEKMNRFRKLPCSCIQYL